MTKWNSRCKYRRRNKININSPSIANIIIWNGQVSWRAETSYIGNTIPNCIPEILLVVPQISSYKNIRLASLLCWDPSLESRYGSPIKCNKQSPQTLAKDDTGAEKRQGFPARTWLEGSSDQRRSFAQYTSPLPIFSRDKLLYGQNQ